jgi:hypothetical protein
MSMQTEHNEIDEMQNEYQFNYDNGIRGKYAGRVAARESEPVLIDKDIKYQ